MLVRESNLHRLYASETEMGKVDQTITKVQRFATGSALRHVASCEDKLKLIAVSMPAFELLTLHMQIAFKVGL